MSWYGLARVVLRLGLPVLADVRIEGTHHVPSRGPFILAANHRSILDAALVQFACPRTVHTMTKSTQFRAPLLRWILLRLHAFPVRRYRVDPQVVRTALGILSAGEAVGLYPEAERSWDGRPQPFRRGAIHLILKAGVPVVPCGVSGSFEVLPRWSRRPRRGPVTIRFGPPMELGRHDTRQERAAAFEGARHTLRSAMDQLTSHDSVQGDG